MRIRTKAIVRRSEFADAGLAHSFSLLCGDLLGFPQYSTLAHKLDCLGGGEGFGLGEVGTVACSYADRAALDVLSKAAAKSTRASKRKLPDVSAFGSSGGTSRKRDHGRGLGR